MEPTPSKNTEHSNLWKSARWGVIIFCIFHFFFEIIIGNEKLAAVPVLFNYFISAWYIKSIIAKGKATKRLFLIGIGVSLVVFIIRFILGTAYTLLIAK
jgi:hypothetical protein